MFDAKVATITLPSELEKFVGWGHSTYEQNCELAIQSDSKKLLMTHHDPRRNDKEVFKIEKDAQKYMLDKKSKITVKAAKEQVIFHV